MNIYRHISYMFNMSIYIYTYSYMKNFLPGLYGNRIFILVSIFKELLFRVTSY